MTVLSQGVGKAGYDFAPWPALPPCGSLSYDTQPGRKWDVLMLVPGSLSCLPAVPFLPSSSPCLPCPESALPWIRKRCWAKGPAASKPSPHMAGFLGCAFTDLQWLPIFSKGLLSRGTGERVPVALQVSSSTSFVYQKLPKEWPQTVSLGLCCTLLHPERLGPLACHLPG